MLFNSLSFILFFIIAYVVYLIIPKKVRMYWLLAASYFFYMNWNCAYALLLLASTAITYVCARLMQKWDKPMLWVSIISNFGILFGFKYLNFAIDSVDKALGLMFDNHMLSDFEIGVLLPVGISFYIFQAVGYTIDVYRKDVEPEKNFFRYALFVSFFPQLVAGPIERSKRLLEQIRKIETIKAWDFDRMRSGFLVALYGYMLKTVIADRAAIYVNVVFDPSGYVFYKGFMVLTAIVLFAIQIYCDFAGYTYIAIGVARIFGFNLCTNFEQPYLSRSVKEFWNRWHISLSTYFRDYLYFPLGGSRKGKLRKCLNLLVVFLVSGLWHGASWHYVFWGLIHAVARIIEELLMPIKKKTDEFLEKKGVIRTKNFSFSLWEGLVTFFFVSFAWVFFRAESLRQGVEIIINAFSEFNPWIFTDGTLINTSFEAKEWNILIVAVAIMIFIDVLKYRKIKLTDWYMKQNAVFRWVFLTLAVVFIFLAGVYGPVYDATAFIYFQF